MSEFDRKNLAGIPEINPLLDNTVNGKAPVEQEDAHIHDNSRHLTTEQVMALEKMPEKLQAYVDHHFMNIIGTFDFANQGYDNNETLANIIKLEMIRNKQRYDELKAMIQALQQ